MPYIPVPKDLTRVKTKFLFNLTKRQLVCFGGGALVGVPLFFLLKGPLGNSSAAICMIVVMMPFFLFALYEKNGLPLEKYLLYFVRACFIRRRITVSIGDRPRCSRNSRKSVVVLTPQCAASPAAVSGCA